MIKRFRTLLSISTCAHPYTLVEQLDLRAPSLSYEDLEGDAEEGGGAGGGGSHGHGLNGSGSGSGLNGRAVQVDPMSIPS